LWKLSPLRQRLGFGVQEVVMTTTSGFSVPVFWLQRSVAGGDTTSYTSAVVLTPRNVRHLGWRGPVE
jgi:hypothetical protein